VLIDDSYNSSPSALRTVLEVVRTDRSAARKVAVLGEMLELGDHAEALHEEIGRVAAGAALDRIFVVGGPAAEALARTASAAMAAGAVRYFRTSDEAAEPVASAIEPGDLVLVKGSRGTRTDRVADRILAEWA
jgi:UDP-N-acetylmuramoyl-tripeptide--D-alanyl-D-alanine ligase